MSGYQINNIESREILDNRLEPTLRVTVETDQGIGIADVPAGRSRGSSEVTEIRDGGKRYNGKGVKQCVSNISEKIAPELEGNDVTNQKKIDNILIELDGTQSKSHLGGNTLTGVSLAVIKCGASVFNQPLYRYIGGVNAKTLPVPVFNMIEGGELSGSQLDFQEHQVIPVGASSFSEAVRCSAEIYYELGDIIESEFGQESLNVGDEGGYNPIGLDDPKDAFELELQAIEECGYEDNFALSIDAAASHFYQSDNQMYSVMDEKMNRGELIEFYQDIVDSYPIVSIEDPLEDEDFEGFKKITECLDIQIVGDDLFSTRPERLKQGIDMNAANCLLLKINQVGTFSEAIESAQTARNNGYNIQVSERSGQTPDTWLADISVGINSRQIKTGTARGERTEQYNRLLKIEDQLDKSAIFKTNF